MMGRLVWCGVLVSLAFPSLAFAWEIDRFETQVAIHPDGTATILETIVADFTGESRHGIYRDLPIHYTDRAGQHFTLRLTVREVTDQAGGAWRVQQESFGRYRRLRIGDPDVTVTGLQTYRITYTVERGVVRFFPDHDECYWNLTGNEWAVPMRRVRAEILLPAPAADVRAMAYVGGYGSTQRLEAVEVQSTRVILEPSQVFGPYEGLTAVVAWEKGLVRPPSSTQVLRWWAADNWVYGVPLLVLLGMIWLWHVRGREPHTDRSQVVEYAPPDELTPAEVGTLMDQRANLRDITATVIDLAVRGYLRLEPQRGSFLGTSWVSDYRLVSLKAWEPDPAIKPHERALLKGLFGRPGVAKDLSDLKDVFYQYLPEIRTHLYTGLVKAGYFDSHPEHVRTTYVITGCTLGGVLWIGLHLLEQRPQMSLAMTLASALVTLIILIFSRIMPRRTRKGAKTTDRIFGFLEFLRRTDQDRIRRLNDPSLFERCLPYALAFGVAEQWARAFEGLYTQPPSWYRGDWDTFSAHRLGRDLDHAASSMGRTFTSAPRSSNGGSSGSWGGSGFGGGGFSGGGGGGGGGGAW
jgi:hypothetical protein